MDDRSITVIDAALLPTHILIKIFSFLDAKQRANLETVCKSWSAVLLNPAFRKYWRLENSLHVSRSRKENKVCSLKRGQSGQIALEIDESTVENQIYKILISKYNPRVVTFHELTFDSLALYYITCFAEINDETLEMVFFRCIFVNTISDWQTTEITKRCSVEKLDFNQRCQLTSATLLYLTNILQPKCLVIWGIQLDALDFASLVYSNQRLAVISLKALSGPALCSSESIVEGLKILIDRGRKCNVYISQKNLLEPLVEFTRALQPIMSKINYRIRGLNNPSIINHGKPVTVTLDCVVS